MACAATVAVSLGAPLTAAGQGGASVYGEQPQAYGVVDRLPIAPVFAGPPTGSVLEESETLGGQPLRLAQNSDFVNRGTDPVDQPPATPGASGPPGRPGIFQGLDLNAEWSPLLDDPNGFGRSSLGATVKLGVPPKLVGMPLMVAPGATLHLLDGPVGIDLPSRLYDLQLGLRTFRRINDRWNAMAMVNVGVYGDDYSLGESEALRPNGMVMAMYNASPAVQWVFGVAVTNREDLPVIPVVGVTLDHGVVRYELTMPRPRIVWRRPAGPGEERSFYLGGELGGGAWAVRRDSGETDTLNLARYGVLLGCESKEASGWTRRYEIGCLFGQEIEYTETGEEFDLDDSLIARMTLSY